MEIGIDRNIQEKTWFRENFIFKSFFLKCQIQFFFQIFLFNRKSILNRHMEEERAQPSQVLRYNRNGFNRPYPLQQLMSYLGYTIEIVMFFCIQFPCFTKNERIGISIPFCITWIIYVIQFIAGALTKHECPYDPSGYHCKWCDLNVLQNSKHCRSCNLCRLGFDHHCFFLNNCVTSSNYHNFIIGISTLTINSAMSFLLSIYIFMNNEMENGFALKQAAYFYQSTCSKAVFYTFNALLMLMNLGILTFTGYLLPLHWCLYVRNCSTFELIQFRRQLQAQKTKQF